MYENFRRQGHDFLLTRTDSLFNRATGQYDQNVVRLAESPGYGGIVVKDPDNEGEEGNGPRHDDEADARPGWARTRGLD